MAVQLSPNGIWVYGDCVDGGTAVVLARTIVQMREEKVGPNSVQGTWVLTSTGVATIFAGNQALAIYQLIKDITIIVV